MKITIIGSSQYFDEIKDYAEEMEKKGNKVSIPAFDKDALDDYNICKNNRDLIEQADEIHILWDKRSLGTIFDFGIAFALRKPIKIIKLGDKTFENVMKKYEKEINRNKKEEKK